MSNKNITELENVVKGFFKELNTISLQEKQLEGKKNIYNAKYLREFEIDLTKRKNELIEKYDQMLIEETEKFRTFMKDYFTPKGSDIDNETTALLNSGIKLSHEEFMAIADKYRTNHTMLRILKEYALKNGLDLTEDILDLNLDNCSKLLDSLYSELKNMITSLGQSYDAFLFTDESGLWQDHISTLYKPLDVLDNQPPRGLFVIGSRLLHA